jgi:bacterioferritin (cytochrome b1)
MKNSELINRLNQQLNRKVSTLVRYMIQAASINDGDHAVVRTMYLNEVGQKVEHAQYLADQIVALGGTPILKPTPASPPATVREMLARDATEEKTDQKIYLQLAFEAEKEMLVGLKMKLEQQADDEHQHGYEKECLLW